MVITAALVDNATKGSDFGGTELWHLGASGEVELVQSRYKVVELSTSAFKHIQLLFASSKNKFLG